jgi:integrase
LVHGNGAFALNARSFAQLRSVISTTEVISIYGVANVGTITKIKGKDGVRFRARVRQDGVSTSRTFASHDEARRWAARLETAVDAGDYTGKDESHRTSLGEALERYLAEVTPTKRGARQEERRIRFFLASNALLCSRKLASLRGQDFSDFKRQRLAAGKASNTVRIDLSLLSQVFVYAAQEWGMENLSNPLKNVRKPPGSQARDRRFTDAEIEAIRACLSPAMLVVVDFALATAMRRGEICRLAWSDVSFAERKIKNVLGRNGKLRSVLMLPRTEALMRALPRPLSGGVVFDFHPDTLTYQFECAAKKASVEGVSFHTLRHEATSRLVEAGLDMKEAMAITGHSAMTMLFRYYHPKEGTIRAKLETAGW